MANPIKIVADVTFDERQIQQAGQATARPALSRLSAGLAKTTRPFSLLITADPSNATQVVEQFAQQVNTSLDGAESKAAQFGKAFAGIGVAGIGVGALLTELGSGEKEAASQLDAAITAAGDSVDEFKGRIESAQSTEEGFAHGHEDTDRALQTLVSSYGDTDKAIGKLDVTTKLAAARHESLATAADQVARVHGGAIRVLKLFDIQVGQNKDGTKNLEGALDQLSQKLDGQPEASVDSFTGHLRVLGTELKDRAAEFGQQYGPAILIASTGLTALGAATSAVVAVQSKLAASRAADLAVTEAETGAAEGLTGSTIGLAASVDALTAALDANTVALGGTVAADEAATVAAGELAVAEEAAAAAMGATALNSAASVAGLYAVEGGALAAGVALAAPLAGAVALTYGLKSLSDHLGLTDTGFTVATDAIKDGAHALDGFHGDLSNFNTDSLSAQLQRASEKGTLLSKALKDGHVTTIEWSNALTGGATELQAFMTWLSKTPGVTREDMDALAGYTQGLQDNTQAAVVAAVKQGDLQQAQVDAAVKPNTINGYTDWAGVVAQLAANGSLAAQHIQEIAPAEHQVSSEQVKALSDELANAKKQADEAFAAVLKLAPADIRAQQGKITIAEDQARLQEAQDKLTYLQNAPLAPGEDQAQRNRDIADAQRDVQSATLDLESATLAEASALEELNKQQILAAGGHVTLQEETSGTIGFLGQLNDEFNGPVHDALQGYIDQMAAAALMTAALDQEQQRQIDNEQRRLDNLPPGFIGPPAPPKATSPAPSAGARAAGGWVPGSATFSGAELGYEVAILPTTGTYEAPPSGEFIIPHAASEGLLSGLTGGSNRPYFHTDQIVIAAPDAVAGANRLPDALATAAHLAGV